MGEKSSSQVYPARGCKGYEALGLAILGCGCTSTRAEIRLNLGKSSVEYQDPKPAT